MRCALDTSPQLTHAMTPATLDKITWTLIYGGILGVLSGLATRSRDSTIAAVLLIAGVVMVAVGVLTVYLRSRMKE